MRSFAGHMKVRIVIPGNRNHFNVLLLFNGIIPFERYVFVLRYELEHFKSMWLISKIGPIHIFSEFSLKIDLRQGYTEIFLSEHFLKHEILSWNNFTLVSKFHCQCFSSMKKMYLQRRYIFWQGKFNSILINNISYS